MTRYAANTDVPSDRSRSEIEKILTRYGATSFAYMNAPGRAVIAFEAQERRVVFTLPLPDKAAREFTHHSRGLRAPPAANEAWEQACRKRWRAGKPLSRQSFGAGAKPHRSHRGRRQLADGYEG